MRWFFIVLQLYFVEILKIPLLFCKKKSSWKRSCFLLYFVLASFISASDPDFPSARRLISRPHADGLHLLPRVCTVCLHFPFVLFCQVAAVDWEFFFHFIFILLHFASLLRLFFPFFSAAGESSPASCPTTPRIRQGEPPMFCLHPVLATTRSNNKMWAPLSLHKKGIWEQSNGSATHSH